MKIVWLFLAVVTFSQSGYAGLDSVVLSQMRAELSMYQDFTHNTFEILDRELKGIADETVLQKNRDTEAYHRGRGRENSGFSY